ncbi:MAG: CPBP family intramembrane glutamic endopeptidase [bacterium]
MTSYSSATSDTRGSGQNRDLPLFLFLTFGIAWILWIPLLVPAIRESLPFGGVEAVSIGAFAPAVGAVAVVRRRGDSVRRWFQRRLRFRAPVRSYLLAFGLPVAIPVSAGVLYIAMGGNPVSDMPPLFTLPVIFVYAALIGGGQEEIGWRGVAQPLIGGRYGLFVGGAVVGVIWVLWHLPLLLSSVMLFESINPVVFGFQTVGVSMLIAWLYEQSGQNLVIAILFHGWRNATEAFYPADVLARSLALAVIWVCVLVLVAVEHHRGRRGDTARDGTDPAAQTFK